MESSSSDSEPEFEEVEPVVLPGQRVAPSAATHEPDSSDDDDDAGPSDEDRRRQLREIHEYEDMRRDNERIAAMNERPGFSAQPADGSTEYKEMTLPEAARALAGAMDYAKKLKGEGNAFYAAADYENALGAYSAATRSLNGWGDLARQLAEKGVSIPGEPTPADLLRDLRVDLMMNTALGNLKTKAYSAVLANCREAFAFDRKCVKALYRSGLALEALGRFGEAEDAFARAGKADPSNGEIPRRLAHVKRSALRSKQSTKKAFGGLFGRAEYEKTAGADADAEARRAREDRASVLKAALARARAVLEAEDSPKGGGGVDRGGAAGEDDWAARHERACDRLAAAAPANGEDDGETIAGARSDAGLVSDRRSIEGVLEAASRAAKTPATAAAGALPVEGNVDGLDSVVAKTLAYAPTPPERAAWARCGVALRTEAELEDLGLSALTDEEYKQQRLVELTNKVSECRDLDADETAEMEGLKEDWVRECKEKLARNELSAEDEASFRDVMEADDWARSDEARAIVADKTRIDALLAMRSRTTLAAAERVELRRLVADDIERLEAYDAEHGLTPSQRKALAERKAERERDAKAKKAVLERAAKKRAEDFARTGVSGDARDPTLRAAAYGVGRR